MLRRSFLTYTAATAAYALFQGQAYSGNVNETTFNISDYLVGSGQHGTEARNADGMDALIRDIAAARGRIVIRGRPGDVYRLEARSTWKFSGLGRLVMEESQFQIAPHANSKSSTTFIFSKGWAVEGMNAVVLSGTEIVRLADFNGSNRLLDCSFTSQDQTANTGKLLDYAVRILRDDNTVERVRISGFDKALLAYGAEGDGNPGRGNRFKNVSVQDYVTAFELRNLADVGNDGFQCDRAMRFKTLGKMGSCIPGLPIIP